MLLVVTGTMRDDLGEQPGAELWRVAFSGWGEAHLLTAITWCWPKRYAVLEDQVVRAAGYVESPALDHGMILTLQIGKPERGRY